MVIDWFGQTYIPSNTDLVYETDLFVGYLPDSPANCIVLYEESGVREGYMNEYASDSTGMLVYGRGSYSFLDENMRDIENNIDNLTEVDAITFRMKSCRKDTGIQQVEVDSRGRLIWTSHFLILTNNFDSVHRQPITQ